MGYMDDLRGELSDVPEIHKLSMNYAEEGAQIFKINGKEVATVPAMAPHDVILAAIRDGAK